MNDIDTTRYVNGQRLLEILFDSESRPSLCWLRRMQAQRRIPFIKIGHLVRFDIEEVRIALSDRWTVKPRLRSKRSV